MAEAVGTSCEPFSIKLWDPDMVSESNLARQVFCEADVGMPKALVLAHRMQAFYGIPVGHEVAKFTRQYSHGAVIVGCTDSLDARRKMHSVSSLIKSGCYWLDLGNTMDSGQVILGGHGLPDFFDIFPKMKKAKDPKDLPSFSIAESLSKQDLFINSTVATLAGQLLWTLMRSGRLTHHGFFINLERGNVRPLPVT